MRLLFLWILLVCAQAACCQPKASDSFKATLTRHLAAITQKNLADIEATVADSVTLIFPDGEVRKSKQTFVEFHKTWFADPSWKMNLQIVKTTEGGTLSHALIKYHYTESDKNGKLTSESHAYLLLIFQKQKDGWKLLHDQNTRISDI